MRFIFIISLFNLLPKVPDKSAKKTYLGFAHVFIPKFFRGLVLKLLHRRLFRDRPAPDIVLAMLKMWNKRTMSVKHHFLKVDNKQVYIRKPLR